ncbi:hypothetical protein MMC08_007698 [Hypocenomyce scalaris]|nr:hypothetical protein [Hypocenomyce scalaris]
MAAKIRKAKIIIGVDIDEGRLKIAQSLGATACLDGSDLDIADQIRTICGGDGVDYAVDCTGVAAIIEKMIDALGTLGKAATIGAPAPGTKISVDVFSQLTKGRQYIGCNQGDSVPQQMIPYLIEQHFQGNFPIQKIVQTYSIEDFAVALEDMKSGKVIKPVLIWRR